MARRVSLSIPRFKLQATLREVKPARLLRSRVHAIDIQLAAPRVAVIAEARARWREGLAVGPSTRALSLGDHAAGEGDNALVMTLSYKAPEKLVFFDWPPRVPHEHWRRA